MSRSLGVVARVTAAALLAMGTAATSVPGVLGQTPECAHGCYVGECAKLTNCWDFSPKKCSDEWLTLQYSGMRDGTGSVEANKVENCTRDCPACEGCTIDFSWAYDCGGEILEQSTAAYCFCNSDSK